MTRARRAMGLSDPQTSEAALEELLNERNRDLELAARLGLLRNQFLEESLNARNDAIQHLQFQLQRRSDLLLEAYGEIDDQLSRSNENGQNGTSNLRQNQVEELQSENKQLKDEINALLNKNVVEEERQEARVRDYLGQLERANFKIAKLQKQIADKTHDCTQQGEEIQRLLREISTRKQREKTILKANDDLQLELNAAIQNHDELSAEILSLQERYSEVVEMLSEAQGELRTARYNPDISSQSLTSLYDSLQSELEASDSGFQSTPQPSARNDQRREVGQLAGPSSELLRLDLGALNSNESADPFSSANQTVRSNAVDYDLPSQVIVDAVRRSLSSERRRLKRAASHSPRDAELIDERTRNNAILPTVAEGVAIDEQQTYRDVCCSPNRVETPPRDPNPPDEPTPRAATSATFFPYSGSTSYAPATTASETATSSLPSSDEEEEETPRSSDSLRDYVGPSLGQPGCPGSRDLDYCLKKLDLRKQIEDEYKLYRQHHGLGPAKFQFYSRGKSKSKHQSDKMASVATNVGHLASSHRSASLEPAKTAKERQTTRGSNLRSQLSTDAVRLNSVNDRPRPTMFRSPSAGMQIFKCAQNRTPRGIDSVIRDRVPYVGILWRSLMTQPSNVQSTTTSAAKTSIVSPDDHSRPKTTLEESELCRRVMANKQIMNSLGLSPVRNRQTSGLIGDFTKYFNLGSAQMPRFVMPKVPANENGNQLVQRSSLID
ncbi:HAP1 N-terminal domain-containing protein [Aphelenchoides besseyi]|nr:HAP1 N-terminal domain-containing protein [Aphelenchoides besseyi]